MKRQHIRRQRIPRLKLLKNAAKGPLPADACPMFSFQWHSAILIGHFLVANGKMRRGVTSRRRRQSLRAELSTWINYAAMIPGPRGLDKSGADEARLSHRPPPRTYGPISRLTQFGTLLALVASSQSENTNSETLPCHARA